MIETLRIRPAVKDDLMLVRTLIAENALPEAGLEEQFGKGFAIAEEWDTVVGTAGVEVYGPYGLLRSVCVSPPWRGSGLGEMLVRDRMKWAARSRLRSLFLLTETAAGYFKRLDYEIVDRSEAPAMIRNSKEFSEVCPKSATLMVHSFRREEYS